MISLNLNIFAAQIITFLAALFVIWKLSWAPLVSMMKQRKEKIRGDLDSAEKLKKESETLLNEYRLKLIALEKEKELIFAKTKQEATNQKEEMIKDAQRETSELRDKVLGELRDEKNAMMRQLKAEIINTAMQLTEKVLQSNIHNIVQKDRYEQMLERLEKSAQENK